MTITRTLVEKLIAIDYASLADESVELAKQVAIDGLGCAMAGCREPLGIGRLCVDYVREMGGNAQASVLGSGFKSSMQNAAYANGTMMNALDFDNSLYPPTHPTSPTLPAILAIAEHYKLPGRKVIPAIVAGIEVQIRLRTASVGMSVGKGFHKPGVIGAFGATTAAMKMLDLPADKGAVAFGLAGSRAAGLAFNTGTMTKPSHAGNAARMGVECALLARSGWTANPDVFGPKGFFDTFMGGHANPEVLVEGFDTAPLRVLSSGVGFKGFPCNYFTHRSIDAALQLRQEYSIKASQIDRVQVVFPNFDYVNRPVPKDGLDGKFSVQYTALAALLDGAITVDTFTNDRLNAPDVRALLPQVEFKVDESIPFDKLKMHVVVHVWLKDGRHVSRKVEKLLGWPGEYGKPLTRDQRVAKFVSCARTIVSEATAKRMLEMLERLEELPDVVEIMDLARGEAAR